MTIVIATDKFKGSLTAAEAAESLRAGFRRALPHVPVITVPVADGGDGTVDAVTAATGRPAPTRAATDTDTDGADAAGETGEAAATGMAASGTIGAAGATAAGVGSAGSPAGAGGAGGAGGVGGGFERRGARVGGPTGVPVVASWALRDGTAVIELAEASGLRRLTGGGLAPLTASSRGTGELIRAALDAGAHTIVLGVGGSACTDGGAGMLAALGARLLGADGADVPDGGAALLHLATVDLTGLDPRVSAARFVLATDVDNPLLGPHGAAAVYAPQKGATPAEVDLLESALAHFAALLPHALPAAGLPGAGAAGGTGFAALAVLGAERRPGVEVLLDIVGFDRLLDGCELVVTGEGSLDGQTVHGKAPVGVAAAAGRRGVRTVAVCGRLGLTASQLADAGFAAAYPLTSLEPDVARCIADAGALLERLAERIAADWLRDST